MGNTVERSSSAYSSFSKQKAKSPIICCMSRFIRSDILSAYYAALYFLIADSGSVDTSFGSLVAARESPELTYPVATQVILPPHWFGNQDGKIIKYWRIGIITFQYSFYRNCTWYSTFYIPIS
jgi:hypothetical protein